MAAEKRYLALDMGAGSGRGVVGTLSGGKIRLEEVHRFANGPTRMLDTLHWDILYQFRELKNAVAAAVRRCGRLESAGVDTWGVDFGLLGRDDVLLGNPCHYLDRRTEGMMDEAFRRMPREKIFEHTGIQFMQLNTVFQLLSMVVNRSPLLEPARALLFMPDLFNFFFTGVKSTEYSIATTSQMFDVRRNEWSAPLFEALGLPRGLMLDPVAPGVKIGSLLPHIAEETGAGALSIVAPACHDTGSAVAAVPARDGSWAYLSSGTWSLIGLELPAPVVTPAALAAAATNEGGVNRTTRFLKNIMGLLIVEECRRAFAADGHEYDYATLFAKAAEAPAFVSFINPNDPSFASFGQMPEKMRAFCRRTGQPEPSDHGAFIRCALESLALCYRHSLEGLEGVLGRKTETLHIVGGGSQNTLLNQFAANALGIPVVAGPVEATAIGNILVQAIAQGELGSLAQAREVVRASFDVKAFEPRDTAAWAAAYERFRRVL